MVDFIDLHCLTDYNTRFTKTPTETSHEPCMPVIVQEMLQSAFWSCYPGRPQRSHLDTLP
jgi:hypothetical protein